MEDTPNYLVDFMNYLFNKGENEDEIIDEEDEMYLDWYFGGRGK